MKFFKDKCVGRKSELDDSLRTHQYYADSSEAEQWIKDKDQLTSSTDYGKDEDSAQVSLFLLKDMFIDPDIKIKFFFL